MDYWRRIVIGTRCLPEGGKGRDADVGEFAHGERGGASIRVLDRDADGDSSVVGWECQSRIEDWAAALFCHVKNQPCKELLQPLRTSIQQGV